MNRRSLIIILFVVALLVLVGFLVRGLFSGDRQQAGLPTAQALRRTLQTTVLATGSITPIVGAEVKVGSRLSGTVKRLRVNVGSRIRAGEVIAELDDRELRIQVEQARANVAAARARLGELTAGTAAQVVQIRSEIEHAESSLIATRSRLAQARTTVETTPVEVTSAIQQAEAALETANANLRALTRTNAATFAQANAALRQAEASRANARTRLERVKNLYAQDFIARQDVDNAQTEFDVVSAQVENAREQVTAVQARNTGELERAEAQVRQAEAALTAAKTGTSRTDLRTQDVAQAVEAVRQAETALRMARANQAQVQVKEQTIQTARAQVAQSEAALRQAETQLSYTRITSPMDGMIASVTTQEGETIAAGLSAPTFVTIIDLTKLQVNALVDETDIGRVAVGQPATFTVDAYADEEFEGTVTAIYPKAVVDQNVVNYDIVIAIANARGLPRPDMTANVIINVATRDNVLAVPNKAVKREEGVRVVYVVENGSPVRRKVVTGWKDADFTEIVSGVKEGDRVLMGDPPATAQNGTPVETNPLPPGATGR